MKIATTAIAICIIASSTLVPAAILPSNSDLWDISQGTTIVGTSGVLSTLYSSDARDMFGGSFTTWPGDAGHTIFRDDQPTGFTHYIQWQTATPVTVQSFTLFSFGDGPTYGNEREFDSFTLRAKSSPSSSTYDLVLYSATFTHPYPFLDAASYALISANITAVTSQNFMAEFVQHNGGRGYDGPRVVELDAFAVPVPEPAVISLAGLAIFCLRKRIGFKHTV